MCSSDSKMTWEPPSVPPSPPRGSILALTAGVTPAERERCLEAGMNAVLAKPISQHELQVSLHAWRDQAA